MKRLVAALAAVALLGGCGEKKRASNCYVGVYFRADATRAEKNALARRLRADERVDRVVYISKEEALRIMERRHPRIAESLPENPLPDALRVYLRDQNDGPDMAESLAPLPAGVTDVHVPFVGRCAPA